MNNFLRRLSERESLSQDEMREVMSRILMGEMTKSEIAGYMVGLRTKGESVEEIVGIVKALREHALLFRTNLSGVIDNCGTGGDGSKSFNISTTSAFVIAGAGIPVAKHGNRSVTSQTGSADVLQHLGIHWEIQPQYSIEILEDIGITFLYAPYVHPKMGQIMKVRRELSIPTVFNLIGPLSNPVNLDAQLLGIYNRDQIELFAKVLHALGRKRGVVINGAGFMDEASLEGENHLVLLEDGQVHRQLLHPHELGFSLYSNQSIAGGDAKENADILISVLKGKKGPYLDTVLLNAGIGLFASGSVSTIAAGVDKARESIASGAALTKLNQLIEKSHRYKKGVS